MRTLNRAEARLGTIAWILVLAAALLRCGSDASDASDRDDRDDLPRRRDMDSSDDRGRTDGPSSTTINPLCGTGQCYPAPETTCMMNPPGRGGSLARDGAAGGTALGVGGSGAAASGTAGSQVPIDDASFGTESGASAGGPTNHVGGSRGAGGASGVGAGGMPGGQGGHWRDAGVSDSASGNASFRDVFVPLDSGPRPDGSAARDASGQLDQTVPPPADASLDVELSDATPPDEDDAPTPQLPIDADGLDPRSEAGTEPDPGAGGSSDPSSDDAGPAALGSGGAVGDPPDAAPVTCYVRFSATEGTVRRGCEQAGSKGEDAICNDSRDCMPGFGCVVASSSSGSGTVAVCRILACTLPASCSEDRFYGELPLRQNGVTLSVLAPVCSRGDHCTLLAASCPTGQVCALVASGVTTCQPPGISGLDADCSSDDRCAEGLVCAKSTHRCMKICHAGSSECGAGKCQAGTGALPDGFGVCIGAEADGS